MVAQFYRRLATSRTYLAYKQPPIRQVRRAEPNETADEFSILLSVALDTRLSLTAAQFRRLIETLLPGNSHAKNESAAKYPVETKPFLPSLHEHLLVWDARQANSETPDAETADAVGLRINHVIDGETIASRKSLKLGFDDIERVLERRKKLSVQRHLRIAEQYIHYTGKGRFPLRYGR